MMKKRKFAPGKSTASKPVKKAEGGSVMRGNAPVVKKMALGGPTSPTTPFTRPDRSGIDRANRGIDASKAARQALFARGLTANKNLNEDILAHPNAANIMANRLAFQPLGQERKKYPYGSPEYDNYRVFYDMEKRKYETAMGGDPYRPRADTSVGTYTAGTYNPATNYIAIGQQQDAAARAAKKAADAAKKAAMPVKRAQGGGITGRQRRAAEDPEFARRRANEATYSGVLAGRRQFAIGSPEAQNYGAYRQMEEAKYRSLGGFGGTPTGTYTAGTYDPNTSYTTLLSQQRAAAKAAKEATMPVKRAKGGMASKPSATKKRDGIAVRGKTKGKMR